MSDAGLRTTFTTFAHFLAYPHTPRAVPHLPRFPTAFATHIAHCCGIGRDAHYAAAPYDYARVSCGADAWLPSHHRTRRDNTRLHAHARATCRARFYAARGLASSFVGTDRRSVPPAFEERDSPGYMTSVRIYVRPFCRSISTVTRHWYHSTTTWGELVTVSRMVIFCIHFHHPLELWLCSL